MGAWNKAKRAGGRVVRNRRRVAASVAAILGGVFLIGAVGEAPAAALGRSAGLSFLVSFGSGGACPGASSKSAPAGATSWNETGECTAERAGDLNGTPWSVRGTSRSSLDFRETWVGDDLRSVTVAGSAEASASVTTIGLAQAGANATYRLFFRVPGATTIRLAGTIHNDGTPLGKVNTCSFVSLSRLGTPGEVLIAQEGSGAIGVLPGCLGHGSSTVSFATAIAAGDYAIDVQSLTNPIAQVAIPPSETFPASATATAGFDLTLTLGDAEPALAVSDVSFLEGDNGATPFVFQVSLSQPATHAVSVDYVTAPDTADAGEDYETESGTLNFAAGEQTKLVTVNVKGDARQEEDETFHLTLTGPSGATIADGIGVGTILNDDHVGFDWTVPDRFGRDDNRDGLVDYTKPDGPVQVRPNGWRVDFKTDDSAACDASQWRSWSIDGTAVQPSDTRAITLDPASCAFSYRFPREGVYEAKLTVRTADGVPLGESTQHVTVQDWLIVSLGDSVGSGEGTPDRAGTPVLWEDTQCHRSASAGPARAAAQIERADPRTSVTFVHLACSGATIMRGILGRYEGQEPLGRSLLRPQFDEMRRLVRDREIDAVLISVGANDVNFSTIVKQCFLKQDCQLATTRGSMLEFFNRKIPHLPGLYDALDLSLRLANIQGSRTYITEYFDPTRDDTGAFCDNVILEEANPSLLFGIDAAEAEWASTDMLVRLNAAVADSATRHGWRYVDEIYSGFRRHGYCAGDRWIVQLSESLRQQGNADGTIHPNEAGHVYYGQRIAAKLQTDLYQDGDLNKPRTPR